MGLLSYIGKAISTGYRTLTGNQARDETPYTRETINTRLQALSHYHPWGKVKDIVSAEVSRPDSYIRGTYREETEKTSSDSTLHRIVADAFEERERKGTPQPTRTYEAKQKTSQYLLMGNKKVAEWTDEEKKRVRDAYQTALKKCESSEGLTELTGATREKIRAESSHKEGNPKTTTLEIGSQNAPSYATQDTAHVDNKDHERRVQRGTAKFVLDKIKTEKGKLVLAR